MGGTRLDLEGGGGGLCGPHGTNLDFKTWGEGSECSLVQREKGSYKGNRPGCPNQGITKKKTRGFAPENMGGSFPRGSNCFDGPSYWEDGSKFIESMAPDRDLFEQKKEGA